MIAPMKRAFVVVLDRERREAVHELRTMGLLHVEPLAGSGDGYNELQKDHANLVKAMAFLGNDKIGQNQKPFGIREGIDYSEEILKLADKSKELFDDIAQISREIERVVSWGNFEPALLADLSGNSVHIRLVELPAKKIGILPDKLDYIIVDAAKGKVRLALVADQSLELPAEVTEFKPSLKSLESLQADLAARKDALENVQAALASLAKRRDALKKVQAHLERDITFETIRSGMYGEDEVAWFSGWIPAKDDKQLHDSAAKMGWGIILDDPLDEEQPPTKVENPPVVRIIQPVFDFLGVVPNYREYDISGLFLLFFVIFFAMIFGDGGYGTIMLIAGIAAAIGSKVKTGKVADPIRLLLILAAATVAWGVCTASWFGIPADRLPAILRNIAVPFVSNANPASSDNVKFLCFCLGLGQLLIAHLKNIIRDIKSLKFIGQVGQLCMVFGIYWIVLNLVVSSARFVVPDWALYFAGVGFALNFIFGSYDGSKGFFKGVLGGIASSMANIVSIFLGVVNIFADLVSYIRLWAVGLAGVGISATVNTMAGPMVGKFSLYLIAGVILLAFGHGLNIILSVLSVIVHGVRLNMLEFSGHLGMEWSGYKYEPFKDTVRSERVDTTRSNS